MLEFGQHWGWGWAQVVKNSTNEESVVIHPATEDPGRRGAAGTTGFCCKLMAALVTGGILFISGCTALPGEVAAEVEPSSPSASDNFRLRRKE